MNKKTIVIGGDHASPLLKQQIATIVQELGYDVIDVGTQGSASVDYPEYGKKIALTIIRGEAEKGIAICGSGIGISIAANRYPEIRAALCHNKETAKLSRQHNDANILVLGARVVDQETALTCVRTFLATEFEGGRHQRRVDMLTNLI